MNVNWQEVIIDFVSTVGGGGVILLAAGWLIRTVISDGLAREANAFKIQLQANADQEIEEFRIKLQADVTTETERLKSALQIAAEEHRVRYAKLHEDRAQRIADLYKRISTLSVDCQRYAYQLGQPDRQEGFKELEIQFSELYLCLEASRIYLPERIYVLLASVINSLRRPGIDILTFSRVNQYARPEVQKEKNDSIIAAVKAFEAEIPAAQKALADEFRNLLGVDN